MQNTYLGINLGHDAGVTYLSDSRVCTLLSERVNGHKRSAEMNQAMLHDLLREVNRDLSTVDHVGITSTQGRGFCHRAESLVQPTGATPRRGTIRPFGSRESMEGSKWHFLKDRESWAFFPYPSRCELVRKNLPAGIEVVRETAIDPALLVTEIKCAGVLRDKPIMFVDHHLAHLFSSLSKVDTVHGTLAISVDGANWSNDRNLSVTFAGLHALFENGLMKFVKPSLFFGGAFYSLVAGAIGLNEGKLMGLASYAESTLDDGTIDRIIRNLEDQPIRSYIRDSLLPFLAQAATFRLRPEIPGLPSFADRGLPDKVLIGIAANAQRIFQRYYVTFVGRLIQRYQPARVVLTGGCVLNCPGNAGIIANHPTVRVLVDNSCNDEGLSIGAAAAVRYQVEGEAGNLGGLCNSPYLGLSLRAADVAITMARKNAALNVLRGGSDGELVSVLVGQLSSNRVGMLIRDGYEIGPRALCHRSFIARADFSSNHLVLNKIKSREPWRPLAPVTSGKHFDRYFAGPGNPYMLVTQRVRDSDAIPAVCHVDMSARCQVVEPDDLLMNTLFDEMNEAGMVPVLINTSLNTRGEPIINDATRAYAYFLEFEEVGFMLIDRTLVIKTAI